MNVLKIVKTASDIIVSAGAGAVIGNAIKATTPAVESTLIKKVTLGVGGFVLSSMVASQASKYSSDTIDNVATQIVALKAAIKK